MKQIPQRWQIYEESLIEDFQIFRLRKSTRINPKTGKPFTFLLMDGLDWVNIIALTNDNKIVLVEQQRHGSDTLSLELPGGCIEKGETPDQAAGRELLEETGYKIQRLEPLGSLYANPAMQSIKVHFFIGYGAVKVTETNHDQGEDIHFFELDFNEFLEKAKNGEISHSLMIAALGMFLLKKSNH